MKFAREDRRIAAEGGQPDAMAARRERQLARLGRALQRKHVIA